MVEGMPVAFIEEGISGVELILTKLHAVEFFWPDNYQFSGGCIGVGVSVVNACQLPLEVWVDAMVFNTIIGFEKRLKNIRTKKKVGTVVKKTLVLK